MFKRQKCKKCGKKTSESYSFCPHCGNKLDSDDWGMLGKNDFMIPNNSNMISLPPGFNSLFNFMVKNLDQQFNQLKKETNQNDNKGISISFSSSNGQAPRINVSPFGQPPAKEKKRKNKRDSFEKLLRGEYKKIPEL